MLKYVNQLTDEELTEIYKLFFTPEDQLVDLEITRFENEICLDGHISIPDDDPEYADETGRMTIDDNYSLTDYDVRVYCHSGYATDEFRKWMLKKFGPNYAIDYLLGEKASEFYI